MQLFVQDLDFLEPRQHFRLQFFFQRGFLIGAERARCIGDARGEGGDGLQGGGCERK